LSTGILILEFGKFRKKTNTIAASNLQAAHCCDSSLTNHMARSRLPTKFSPCMLMPSLSRKLLHHITASKFLDKECEYKVICYLLHCVISNDTE